VDSRKIEETFAALVESESKRLFRFLYWSLGRQDEARDALQDVLIRIHRGLTDLRDDTTIQKWVYRIATNVAHDYRNARRTRTETYGLDAEEDARPRPSSARTPAEEAAEKDTNERLRVVLSSLPEELRAPLLLHTLNGMKYREVADALDLPIGTITSRIHHARMLLQEALRDEMEE
jgi:RNA polymerase sigma-70 factor (ECF subfamily)